MQTLEEKMAAIRSGQRVGAEVPMFLADGQLTDAAAKAFEHDLVRATEPEREHLVAALLTVGRRADPAAQPGILLLREPRVIALLAGPGARSIGAARDAGLEALLETVPVPLLLPQGKALADDLATHGDSLILRLVAKVKPPEARPQIARLAAAQGAAGGHAAAADEPTRIALAAFGDARLEGEFVRAFDETKAGAEKARLARVLATVGTPRAMQALASAMRSDLVITMPAVMRRSVRVDIVAALSFAFPDKDFLWDNAVRKDADYARIEAFCEQTFGVKYTQPRPPFLWIEGFPADHEY